MNLTPAGLHLLDTSAAVFMLRFKVTASVEALVPFATLGELATGTFRVADRAREAARVRVAIGPARAIFPTEQTTVHFGRITATAEEHARYAPFCERVGITVKEFIRVSVAGTVRSLMEAFHDDEAGMCEVFAAPQEDGREG